MKRKILKYTLIGVFLFMSFLGIKEVHAEKYTGQAIWPSEHIPNIFIRKYRDDGYIKYQQARFMRRSEDNAFMYCLQPFVDIDNNLEDIENVQKNNYKVFSCFSCGGGSTMGYKLAGYDVIGNCEIDKKINDIYVKNHHPKYNYCMGIQEMNKLKELPKELYNLDILDGSPPCSTFSLCGEREKNWGKNKKFREGQTSQILNEIGYNTQLFLLNAARMGVPQRRERLFFIAINKSINVSKIKLEFNESPIKYGEIKDSNYKLLNQDTLTYERWKKRIARDVKLSDTIKRTEKGKISCFNTQYLKDDRTPATIAAGGSPPLSYDVPGYASDKDIITIQTFPQDYDFMGMNVQYVCGMSVPPIMMKKIAEQIKVQLLDKMQRGDEDEYTKNKN